MMGAESHTSFDFSLEDGMQYFFYTPKFEETSSPPLRHIITYHISFDWASQQRACLCSKGGEKNDSDLV